MSGICLSWSSRSSWCKGSETTCHEVNEVQVCGSDHLGASDVEILKRVTAFFAKETR
jgi:hypothetical protein